MNIIENNGYQLSVIASKPDEYSRRSHIAFYSKTDDQQKEKQFEMFLDQWGIDSLIDYLTVHRNKVANNLFVDNIELL